MGKERFEQWLYDTACIEAKHFHGNNGIFSLEEYHLECSEKKQLQSFLGVGAQHQNFKAERAIQTIMYMACTFLVHSSLHWTDMGADDISLWPFAVEDPQFSGGGQTAPKLPHALANTTKSSTRVSRLS